MSNDRRPYWWEIDKPCVVSSQRMISSGPVITPVDPNEAYWWPPEARNLKEAGACPVVKMTPAELQKLYLCEFPSPEVGDIVSLQGEIRVVTEHGSREATRDERKAYREMNRR